MAKKLTGAGARKKGLDHEREVVNKLKKYFPKAERAMVGSYYDNNGVDVRGVGKLLIQCKRNRKYAPITAIEEIQISNGIPILWTRADRKRSVVCMYEEDFLKIIGDIGEIYDRDDFDSEINCESQHDDDN